VEMGMKGVWKWRGWVGREGGGGGTGYGFSWLALM